MTTFKEKNLGDFYSWFFNQLNLLARQKMMQNIFGRKLTGGYKEGHHP